MKRLLKRMLEMRCHIAHSDSVDYFDMIDSDDETYDPANPDHEDYF